MTQITATLDKAQMEDIRSHLSFIKNGYERAMSRSLNAGANKAKSLATKGIAATVNTLQKNIRGSLDVSKATFGNLSAVMHNTRIPIWGSQFKHQVQAPNGVAFHLYTAGAPRRWPHAWFGRMQSGHEGIFATRRNSIGPRGGKTFEVAGPNSVTLYLHTPGLAPKVEGDSADWAMRELGRQADYLIRKELGQDPAEEVI